jgi:Domain of unknown function (DUF4389)
MSAFYATPDAVPSAPARQQTPAPILVAFAGPSRQSRLTVLIRIFMVLPQLIVVGLLGVAAYVIMIIGWFGALFTGRLPFFAADFLTGYLRWLARVYAYTLLLTDVYPPFSLADADYPVRVAAMPGRLNRLAVLFRFFLLIPCWFVLTIVGYGAFTIVQFVTWLIVLISGQMPDALHAALAAALRYQIRTLGFLLMLTSAYPAGLFGDREPPGYGDPQGYGAQAGYGAQPGYGDAQGFGGQSDAEAGGEAFWRLILSGGARKLMVAFIVIGVLLVGVDGGVGVAFGARATNAAVAASASGQVQVDSVPVSSAINGYSANATACHGQLSCITGLDRRVAAALDTFAGQLRAIPMPAGQASSADATLASSVSRTASIFARLGAATSASQYVSLASSSNLQQSVNQVNQDYTNLGNALNS